MQIVTDLWMTYNYECECPECKDIVKLFEEDFIYKNAETGETGCYPICPHCKTQFYVIIQR